MSRVPGSPGAKTIKKNTNSTQNKSQTHRAKQYEVTSFLSTDCELSTETCSKNVYSLGPLIPESERHNFWRQKAFLGNPGLQKSPSTDSYRRWSCDRCVLLSGALECTKTQWDKLKILRMFVGDVFLWNVSKQLVISCARTASLERRLPRSTWMGDNRGVTVTKQNGPK